jgi:hypothetical protein
MRLARLADAEQLHAARARLDEEHRRALAEREPGAVHAARIGDAVADRGERVKPLRGQTAQRVRGARDHRVAHAEREQRARRRERARARRARGGERVGGPAHAEVLGREAREPAELELRVVERGVSPPSTSSWRIAVLGVGDARGARAHHHADALGPVLAQRARDRSRDLRSAAERHRVVAAVVLGELRGDLRQRIVHRTDAQHAVGREVVAIDEPRRLTVEQPRPHHVAPRRARSRCRAR